MRSVHFSLVQPYSQTLSICGPASFTLDNAALFKLGEKKREGVVFVFRSTHGQGMFFVQFSAEHLSVRLGMCPTVLALL